MRPPRDGPCCVSVVLVAHNEQALIGGCIDAILANPTDNPPYELIVVDDGSTDRTPEILREYREKHSNVIVLDTSHVGKGAGTDAGLDVASGDHILLTDADTLVPPDWIRRMADALSTVDVATAAWHLHFPDRPSLFQRFEQAHYVVNCDYGGSIRVPMVGSNMGLRRSAVNDIGRLGGGRKAVSSQIVESATVAGLTLGYFPGIAVEVIEKDSIARFVWQRLRWRDDLFRRSFRPERQGLRRDLRGFVQAHGFSFLPWAGVLGSVLMLSPWPFVGGMALTGLCDILRVRKALWRMYLSRTDRAYAFYYPGYVAALSIVRLAQLPYTLYRLGRGGAAFRPIR